MGTIVSRHSCVSAQLYVTTILSGHSRMGMFMYGHNRVWAQTCLDTVEWARSCIGTILFGYKRVWAQSCLGTNVSGHNHVRTQSSGHSCVGTIVYGHKRGETITVYLSTASSVRCIQSDFYWESLNINDSSKCRIRFSFISIANKRVKRVSSFLVIYWVEKVVLPLAWPLMDCKDGLGSPDSLQRKRKLQAKSLANSKSSFVWQGYSY